MIDNSSRLNAINAFWQAFAEIEPQLSRDIIAADRKRLNAHVEYLFEILGSVDPRLCPEIGRDRAGDFELCISPDGHEEAIDAAQAVVRQAPQIENWRIFAFKQRMDINDIEVEIGEDKISARSIRFSADFTQMPLDLTLYFNVGEYVPVEPLYGISNIFLDRSLGEFDAIMGIGALKVRVGCPPTARPLTEFAKEFDAAALKLQRKH